MQESLFSLLILPLLIIENLACACAQSSMSQLCIQPVIRTRTRTVLAQQQANFLLVRMLLFLCRGFFFFSFFKWLQRRTYSRERGQSISDELRGGSSQKLTPYHLHTNVRYVRTQSNVHFTFLACTYAQLVLILLLLLRPGQQQILSKRVSCFSAAVSQSVSMRMTHSHYMEKKTQIEGLQFLSRSIADLSCSSFILDFKKVEKES